MTYLFCTALCNKWIKYTNKWLCLSRRCIWLILYMVSIWHGFWWKESKSLIKVRLGLQMHHFRIWLEKIDTICGTIGLDTDQNVRNQQSEYWISPTECLGVWCASLVCFGFNTAIPMVKVLSECQSSWPLMVCFATLDGGAKHWL